MPALTEIDTMKMLKKDEDKHRAKEVSLEILYSILALVPAMMVMIRYALNSTWLQLRANY